MISDYGSYVIYHGIYSPPLDLIAPRICSSSHFTSATVTPPPPRPPPAAVVPAGARSAADDSAKAGAEEVAKGLVHAR